MKKLLIMFMITTLLVVGCGKKKEENKEPDKKPETEEKVEIEPEISCNIDFETTVHRGFDLWKNYM